MVVAAALKYFLSWGLRERERGRAGGREGGRSETGGNWRLTAMKYFLSQKRDLLTDIVSQKRDLLTDCQSDHEG